MPDNFQAPPDGYAAHETDSETPEGRHLWGEYKLIFRDIEDANGDVINVDIDVVPLRTNQAHVDVTNFILKQCHDCVNAIGKSATPDGEGMVIEANIWLKNPTNLVGYDVRGIIYPPAWGAELRGPYNTETQRWETPDGMTRLYNTGMPSPVNGYMAFNPTEKYRPFGAHAQ
ncbi:MAG TPA: hypothetical protein ENN67_01805, partial [Firmicutes bacterium]|nr:hypothetical protein [Bacillota bacterium]